MCDWIGGCPQHVPTQFVPASLCVPVVGAGLSGATIARVAAEAGSKVLVIDKRAHVGGNIFDYVDPTGFRVAFQSTDSGLLHVPRSVLCVRAIGTKCLFTTYDWRLFYNCALFFVHNKAVFHVMFLGECCAQNKYTNT